MFVGLDESVWTQIIVFSLQSSNDPRFTAAYMYMCLPTVPLFPAPGDRVIGLEAGGAGVWGVHPVGGAPSLSRVQNVTAHNPSGSTFFALRQCPCINSCAI